MSPGGGGFACVCSPVCLQPTFLPTNQITGACFLLFLAPRLQHLHSLEWGTLVGLLILTFDLPANAGIALASCIF